MSLNLARRLRPKNFSTILGQKLTLEMLQNCLQEQNKFPAYLFAGQRGCGKTTTARVFAAALNCSGQESKPCLECASCQAMQSQEHPDFHEIDAASHTGVDNVRQILEAANYQPALGRYKIYLIDETHMLSKAAFNALLKILEEPPHTACFILATTEIHKVPVTVRSRCFLGSFQALSPQEVFAFLQKTAEQEKIQIADEALHLLVAGSQGSVRDALNLLEQVAACGHKIEVADVESLLQLSAPKNLLEVFGLVLQQDAAAVSAWCAKLPTSLAPQTVFDACAAVLLGLVRAKLGVLETNPLLFGQQDKLQKLASPCSLEKLNALVQLFFSLEEGFLKTSNKILFLEHMLI